MMKQCLLVHSDLSCWPVCKVINNIKEQLVLEKKMNDEIILKFFFVSNIEKVEIIEQKVGYKIKSLGMIKEYLILAFNKKKGSFEDLDLSLESKIKEILAKEVLK